MTGDTEPDDKAFRLQLLLHNLVSQAVRENNEDLVGQIRESVIKELDYQFRMQEEENERRNQEHISREEEHYRELDEKLREYSGKKQKKVWGRAAKEKRDKMENAKQMKQDEKSNETMANNDETAQTIVKKRRQKSPRIWIRKKA